MKKKLYQHVAVVHVTSPEKDGRRVFAAIQQLLDEHANTIPPESLPDFERVEVLGATPPSSKPEEK